MQNLKMKFFIFYLSNIINHSHNLKLLRLYSIYYISCILHGHTVFNVSFQQRRYYSSHVVGDTLVSNVDDMGFLVTNSNNEDDKIVFVVADFKKGSSSNISSYGDRGPKEGAVSHGCCN